MGVAADGRDSAAAALAEYRALDVIVVRGLATASSEGMISVAEAAAP